MAVSFRANEFVVTTDVVSPPDKLQIPLDQFHPFDLIERHTILVVVLPDCTVAIDPTKMSIIYEQRGI